MIKTLLIENFQSHKATRMDFHPGVNAIIGPSDSGKTAIFRALKWVAENRPAGKDFHSWWKGDPRVEVRLNESIEVVRERIKGENFYQLTGLKEGLTAFGQRVPDQVKEALNLSPINFQWQMDSSFLLSQSSGEVSRYLNEVVNLESIDLALLNIERRLRAEKSDVAYCEKMIKQKQEQIEAYEWLPGADKGLQKLEKLDRQVKKLLGAITGLDELMEVIRHHKRGIRRQDSILEFKEDVDELLALEQEIEESDEKYNELADLLNSIDDLQGGIAKVDALVKFEPEVDRLLGLSEEIEKLQENVWFLTDDLNNIKDTEEELLVLEHQADELRIRYNGLMPDVCPLCEQPIKKKRRRGN